MFGGDVDLDFCDCSSTISNMNSCALAEPVSDSSCEFVAKVVK